MEIKVWNPYHKFQVISQYTQRTASGKVISALEDWHWTLMKLQSSKILFTEEKSRQPTLSIYLHNLADVVAKCSQQKRTSFIT